MNITSQRGLAVVTGAAGGLGAAFARQLAERGYRLFLVDRRPKQLAQIGELISAQQGVAVETCVVDLCQRDEVEALAKALQRMPDLELLVNNAGFGTVDYFVDIDAKNLVNMVDLHVATPTILVRAALPGMLARNCGAIINVSSLAAWFQCAGNVPYWSTKNFLAVFSLALHEELRATNVRVKALCPGFVRTEFHAAESMKGFDPREIPSARFWMSADDVVSCALRSLSGKRVLVIPGLGYRVLARLAQMPLLWPLFRWIARRPRLAANAGCSAEDSTALSPAAKMLENV
jgi:short-subunit dehydrogenase